MKAPTWATGADLDEIQPAGLELVGWVLEEAEGRSARGGVMQASGKTLKAVEGFTKVPAEGSGRGYGEVVSGYGKAGAEGRLRHPRAWGFRYEDVRAALLMAKRLLECARSVLTKEGG